MDQLLANSLAIGEIVWINLLLSGDNAVVIALACRSLEPKQRWFGLILGTGAAIALRIIFAFLVSWLMGVPFLKLIGGLLLLWIAVKLVLSDETDKDIEASHKLWRAVGTIALADLAMSLDNVIAIAAVAKGNHWLFIFGLVLSMPLIMVGATLITNLVTRFPLVVWAGAGLLGWIGGEMIAEDDAAMAQFGLSGSEASHYALAVASAALVVIVSYVLKRRQTVEANVP